MNKKKIVKLNSFKQRFTKRKLSKIFYERIYEKSGKGIDGITFEKFKERLNEHLNVIVRKCKKGTYKFSKYMELLKSKGRGKAPRVISISTIRDKLVLIVLKNYLHDVFDDCINRSLPNKYVRDVIQVVKGRQLADPHFYKADIDNFYGTIDRGILYKILNRRIKAKQILNLIKLAVEQVTVPFGKRGLVIEEKRGIPQGLPISNILANIYMTDMDSYYHKNKTQYFRYVDDILIITDGPNEKTVEAELKSNLDKLVLDFSPGKKDFQPAHVGVDYLGYRISLDKISVRKATVERFIQSVAAIFANFSHNSERKLKKFSWLTRSSLKNILVDELNEKITGAISEKKRYGWVFYFQEITDIPLLFKMDKIIEGFFERMEDFKFSAPKTLKRLVRAHYESIHSPLSGYIHNYNTYKTFKQKFDYLAKLGYINRKRKKMFTTAEIEDLFIRVRQRHLAQLELDTGTMS